MFSNHIVYCRYHSVRSTKYSKIKRISFIFSRTNYIFDNLVWLFTIMHILNSKSIY
nr:MAG TPA: hypothetical protein [Bacteriophage sp.]